MTSSVLYKTRTPVLCSSFVCLFVFFWGGGGREGVEIAR